MQALFNLFWEIFSGELAAGRGRPPLAFLVYWYIQDTEGLKFSIVVVHDIRNAGMVSSNGRRWAWVMARSKV
jgi:hypothetical protein